MNRKTYMKEVYSNYWLNAREKVYGFLEYDKNLCNYICEHIPNGAKLLDVGIGTGYPFADFFQKKSYQVYGLDISPELIEKCLKLYPEVKVIVCDAEDIGYGDKYFDCTYGFHSTWYFPSLKKAIEEMIRVTRPGGLVIFDIQNRENKDIEDMYRKRLNETRGVGRFKKYIKNVAKMVLRRGHPDWHFVVHEVPTYPQDIYRYLKECDYPNTFIQVYGRERDNSMKATNKHSSFEQYDRLIFVVSKS